MSSSGSSSAALDVCLIKENIGLNLEWKVLDNVGSDHLPTLLSIKGKVSGLSKLINKVNWQGVVEEWDAEPVADTNLTSIEDIDNYTIFLTDKINQIESNHTTKRLRRFNGECMLSRESRELIELRRDLCKIRRTYIGQNWDTTTIRKVLKICINPRGPKEQFCVFMYRPQVA